MSTAPETPSSRSSSSQRSSAPPPLPVAAVPSLQRWVIAMTERDVVLIDGPEAEPYLQGQISADVAAMLPGDSALSFLLEPRGQIEALFSINRTGAESFVADVEPGFGETVAASLGRFKLATKVDFEPQRWTMHAVRGPAAAQARGAQSSGNQSGAPAAVADAGSGADSRLVLRRTLWPLADGFDVLSGDPEAPVYELAAQSAGQDSLDSLASVDRAGYEALRMAFGLPAMGSEIQPGDIPNETGLVSQAASFTKGCYRGQELVERIDSRTGGRRTVCRIIAQAPLEAGESLMDSPPDSKDDVGKDDAGTTIGTVLSAATLELDSAGAAGGLTVGFARAQRDRVPEDLKAGDGDIEAVARTAQGQPVYLVPIC